MGIHKLFQTLENKAPGSIREVPLNVFTGKKVAVDASKTIYQFLVSTTNVQGREGIFSSVVELTDSEGNLTG